MAGVLEALIARLVRAGYPANTAKKIATGELPMDFNSRMNRAREQGYTMDALHAGNPDIREFDPRAPRRTIDEGYDIDSVGSFFTDNPVIAASYSGPESATYRVLINPKNFGKVNAKGNYYNTLDASKYIRPSGEVVDAVEAANTYLGKMPSQTDDFGIMAKNVGDQGVIIENVVDMGPKTKPMRMVAEDVSGGDRMNYLTKLENQGAKTIIVQDPSTIRSYYGAAFDPDNKGLPNILGGAAPIAAGGVLAALGMAPQEAEAGVFPYAFKMAEDALQRSRSLFTEKALKSAASDASGNSRTAITMMSPDEFLRVVPTPENSISQKNIDKIAEHIKSGGKLDDVPFLIVKMDDEMKMPRYSGHEGRHRALAFKQLGIEEMPVRIKMGDDMGIRWDELHSKNPLRNKSLPDFVLHEEGKLASQFPIKKTPTGFETARAVAPLATGGILAALGGKNAEASTAGMNEIMARRMNPEPTRIPEEFWTQSNGIGVAQAPAQNPISQGAEYLAGKLHAGGRAFDNAGILSLLGAPLHSLGDIASRAAYGESKVTDPAEALLSASAFVPSLYMGNKTLNAMRDKDIQSMLFRQLFGD